MAISRPVFALFAHQMTIGIFVEYETMLWSDFIATSQKHIPEDKCQGLATWCILLPSSCGERICRSAY